MAKSLEKARKQIAKKKKSGVVAALHQRSRDSQRLHRARTRDERLEKLLDSRKRKEQPLLQRVRFFQECIKQVPKPLSLEETQEKIIEFVHRDDQSLKAIKSQRRPGRPSSTTQELLERKRSSLEKEYLNGFLVPDLTEDENIKLLRSWTGAWSYLPNLSWVRVSSAGVIRQSSFPPKGDH